MKAQQTDIISISDLSIGYITSGKQQVLLSSLSVQAGKGELVALIGRNGAGKSTLLRTLTKQLPPLSGKINIIDKNLEDYSMSRYARFVSFVSTEVVRVNNLRVIDLVALGRFPHTNWLGKLQPEDHRIVSDAIASVGLSHLAYKNSNQISDGERQRVMIARAIAQDTPIIILDEPTAFLDITNRYEIVDLLLNLSRQKEKTIVFSSHDLSIAMQEADKIWLMDDKNILQGAPEDLIINNSFNKLFQNSRVRFDVQTGEFRLHKKSVAKITLSGNNKLLIWTRKALERVGFGIANDVQEISINVGFAENKPVWELTVDNNKMEFFTIYDLSVYLKNYIYSTSNYNLNQSL
jgi:iron complex transport system ATP-binding protein